jgi:hypothetical protein
MIDFAHEKPTPATLLDHLLAGGVFSAMAGVSRNWSERKEPRRLIYAGIVCLGLCAVSLFVGEISKSKPSPGSSTVGGARTSRHS